MTLEALADLVRNVMSNPHLLQNLPAAAAAAAAVPPSPAPAPAPAPAPSLLVQAEKINECEEDEVENEDTHVLSGTIVAYQSTPRGTVFRGPAFHRKGNTFYVIWEPRVPYLNEKSLEVVDEEFVNRWAEQKTGTKRKTRDGDQCNARSNRCRATEDDNVSVNTIEDPLGVRAIESEIVDTLAQPDPEVEGLFGGDDDGGGDVAAGVANMAVND